MSIKKLNKNSILFVLFLLSYSMFTNSLNTNTNTKLRQPTNSNISIVNKNISTNEKFFIARLGSCNNVNCNPKFGKCMDGNICTCNQGFADSFLFNEDKNSRCSYKQKLQLIAFILELLFGAIGGGNLYIGNVYLSFLKTALLIFVPLTWYCVFYRWLEIKEEQSDSSLSKAISWYIPLFYSIIIFSWLIIDLLLFILNFYVDSKGIPLNKW